MPVRVSPTDRIRHQIDELFADGRPLPEILEEVARLGAQLLMQAALEAEVTEFLGRDRYQRAAASAGARPGSRNGYREVSVKTTAGPVGLARPKLRGAAEAFASRLFGSYVTKTNAQESLVIASFVRGLSVRDVEAALAEALGDQAASSKSTVSSVCQQIKEEYQVWAKATKLGFSALCQGGLWLMSSVPFPDLSGSPDANGSTRAVVTPDLPVLTSGSEP